MPDLADGADPEERGESHGAEQADEDEGEPWIPLPDDEEGEPDAQHGHEGRDERHLDQSGQCFQIAG